MTKTLLLAAGLVLAASTAAEAECSLYGTKYAPGASTRDLSGTRIYCGSRGSWQNAPTFDFRSRIGPDGRFRPIELPPPLGSADYYRYWSDPSRWAYRPNNQVYVTPGYP